MGDAQSKQFGQYRFIRRLAQGGMAEIWIAREDSGPDRDIVVKRIHTHLASDAQFVMMFLDEARIAARLDHPGCVQIFDLGCHEGSYYLAMEYIHGEDIRSVAKQAREKSIPLPRRLAIEVVAGAAEGLHYAHEVKDTATGKHLNVVHRDVSPQNILVTYDGCVKIVDFGIAKAADQVNRTQAGVLKGKYAYMSPEQVLGLPLDRRSDVFALGILLYELTTGRRLFKSDTELETMRRIMKDIDLPTVVSPGYPKKLEAIVMKALARNRDHRYESAEALQRDLRKFLGEHSSTVTPEDLSIFMSKLFSERLEAEREAELEGDQEALLRARFGDESESDSDGSGESSSDGIEEIEIAISLGEDSDSSSSDDEGEDLDGSENAHQSGPPPLPKSSLADEMRRFEQHERRKPTWDFDTGTGTEPQAADLFDASSESDTLPPETFHYGAGGTTEPSPGLTIDREEVTRAFGVQPLPLTLQSEPQKASVPAQPDVSAPASPLGPAPSIPRRRSLDHVSQEALTTVWNPLEEAERKSSRWKKSLIVAGGLLSLLLAGGTVLLFMDRSPSDPSNEDASEASAGLEDPSAQLERVMHHGDAGAEGGFDAQAEESKSRDNLDAPINRSETSTDDGHTVEIGDEPVDAVTSSAADPPSSEASGEADAEAAAVESTDTPAATDTRPSQSSGGDAKVAEASVPSSSASRGARRKRPAPAAVGFVTITADAPGSVLREDSVLGPLPLNRHPLSPGEHLLVVRGSEAEQRLKVQVEAGRVSTHSVSLRTGLLRVRATPWAELSINGRRIGTTPIAPIRIPAGRHTLEAHNPELDVRRSIPFVMEPGGEVFLNIDLGMEPQEVAE